MTASITGTSGVTKVSLGARTDRFFSAVPFYTVLLSAYPVLRLYADNLADVDPAEVLMPLLLALGASTIGVVILAAIWGEPRRAAIIVAAIVVPFIAFGIIADAVAPIWPYEPIVRAYLVALLIWLALVFFAVYAAIRLQRRLAAVTQALNILSVALIVLTVVPIMSGDLLPGRAAGAIASEAAIYPDDASVAAAADRPRRDIYHLVLDRYGSEDALRIGLGIDNSSFVEWLRAHGFQVMDHAHANYERTALSLSSTHGMSLHEELAGRMGPASSDLAPLYHLIRNSAAASTLQSLGYTYYHLGSWFEPTSESDIAEYVEDPGFRVSFTSTLVDQSAVTGLREIGTMLTDLSAHGSRRQQADVTTNQFARLAEMASLPGPKYVFAHLLVPHDPYLFQADGTFDPQQATFETQLEYANSELRQLIEPLLQLPPEERPVIVVQADEGPYPPRYEEARDDFDWSTATNAELVTKFGVLNAMYLPGPEGVPAIPQDITLVNTFPELLQRYFGLQIPRVADRTFALGGGGPYDLHEITDELQRATEEVGGTLDEASRPPDPAPTE